MQGCEQLHSLRNYGGGLVRRYRGSQPTRIEFAAESVNLVSPLDEFALLPSHPGLLSRRLVERFADTAVAHGNGAVPEGGGFRIVGDHQHGLPELLIQLAQKF